MVKKLLSIDPNVKGAISESFDKSHLSNSFDVPAGCMMSLHNLAEPNWISVHCDQQLLTQYLIHDSERYFTHLGSHTFKCSKGSNILFKYVCDGILDCPDDTSDKDLCMCNASLHPCKVVISKKNSIVCFSVYCMMKNGHCIKYANPEKIYKILNIIHDLPK